MFKLVSLLLILGGVISCGPKTGPSTEKYTTTSVGEPKTYQYLDYECRTNSSFSILNPSVSMFFDGDYGNVKLPYLKNKKLVNEVVMGGKVEIVGRHRTYIKPIKKPKKFKHCIKDNDLGSQYYEDAVLSILGPLNEFEKKYPRLIKANKIPKVQVLALPQYTRIHHVKKNGKKYKVREHLINNAMYSPFNKQIIFLPQGATTDGYIPFGGVPLWKSSMVTMHEFGHHFFRTLLGRIIFDRKMSFDEYTNGCVDTREVHNPFSILNSKKSLTNSKRSVSLINALGALNEGFADLFAYYTTDSTKNHLKDLGCMEKSREVNESRFLARDRKVLSSEVMNIFLSKKQKNANSCIVETDYQDIHIIGAIYAHAFYKLLNLTSDSEEIKIKLLLNWVKRLKPLYLKKLPVEEFLNEAAIEFYKVVDRQYALTSNHCRVYFLSFPQANHQCN